MREDAVLHAGQEDGGELQALGGVQRHQGDDAGAFLVLVGDLVGVGDQRDLLQEVGEGARVLLAAVLLEFQGDGGQFLEVLDAGLVLRVGRSLELGEVARTLQDRFQDGGGARAGLHDGAQLLHQRVEALDGVGGARGHAVGLVDPAQRLREGDLLAGGQRVDHGFGALADAALGHVQDAAQRDAVLGVAEDAQVREDVADLLALVEAHAADDLVGQADPDEDLFEDTGLGVGAVEHRDVARLGVARVRQPVDLVGDELGLVVLGVGDVPGDAGALAGVRPQVLGAAVLVALDDGVGGAEDRLGGAVVLLQHDRRGVRIVLLELEDVTDRGAAERVDRLVGVTDHAQLTGGPGRTHQLAHQGVLGVVGVLVLVHEDVPEAAAVVVGDIRERLEEVDRGHDDVVEVQGVGLAQPRLVHPVRLGDRLLEAVGRLVREGLLVDELVLEVGDLGAEGLGREPLGVEVQVPADQGHQALGVGRVVDREGRGEAQLLGLAAQDAHARAVEGGDPHGVRPRADQFLDALLHLARGLVGEGDREDLARVHTARAEQMRDAVRQDAGLAGAGAGDDEQRAAGVDHGGLLLVVEPLQEGGRIHRGAGGAVAVVRVAARADGVRDAAGHVEAPAEQVGRDLLLCRTVLVLGRRRGPFTRGFEVRQEAVVKEAAHRPPSLGRRTDSPARTGKTGRVS